MATTRGKKVGTRNKAEEDGISNGVKKLKVNETRSSKRVSTTKKTKKSTATTKTAKKPATTAAKAPVRKIAKAKAKAKAPKRTEGAAKKEAPKPKVPAKPAEPKIPAPAPFPKTRAAAFHQLFTRPKTSGKAMVFGSGDCGQLGLGEDILERKKPYIVKALDNTPVVSVACGGLHTVALTANGSLWSWGCNDQGALARSGDEFEAARVEGLDGVRVTQVACSDSATFALSEDGHVFAWGTFRSAEGIMGFSQAVNVQARPVPINALREPIVSLCAGVDHALALSVSGRVYAWGYGHQGQLGRLIMERRLMHGLTPECLSLREVQHIGCGSYHSFAATKDGTVYAWGLNNFHQLGLHSEDGGSEDVVHKPTPVRALADAKIVRISGGEHHSIALSADGHLYAFGRSDSHQAGLPANVNAESEEATHKKAVSEPTRLKSLSSVAEIACGSNHNIALNGKGEAFTWGYGEMLQLGNGQEEDVAEPMLLAGQKIEGKRILSVAAGGQHSSIVAA